MSLKNRIHLFEEDSKILQEFAKQHGEESREYAALKRASLALWYVITEDYANFAHYMNTLEGNLTPEQRTRLAEMGIDPDSIQE